MIKPFVFLFCITISLSLFSQKNTVFGSVKDSITGENLVGAYIIIKETNQGVTSNSYGFYSITSTAGKFTLICSYIGYAADTIEIFGRESIKLNISLSPGMNSLDERDS